MKILEELYYEQSALWNRPSEPYQKQVLADILSMLPRDVESILDVGCGDGFITNSLPEDVRVVGLDISEEAIKYVTRERLAGSIAAIRFADGSFDLAMANDVIEHLPEDVYGKAVSELFRVAGKYVLITVPFQEQLEKTFARCAGCGFVYHVNLHYRSFSEKALTGLAPEGWSTLEVRYSGDITRPAFDPAAKLGNAFQIFMSYDKCVCPKCGCSEVFDSKDGYAKRVLKKLGAEMIFEDGVFGSRYINRTEIIVLFGRKGYDQGYRKPEPAVEFDRERSPLEIDFKNPFQCVSGFTEGNFWAKHTCAGKGPNGTYMIWMNFPVVPQKGDRILVRTSGKQKDFKGTLCVHDYLEINAYPVNGTCGINDGQVEFLIDKSWSICPFGATVSLEVSDINEIESIEYVPSEHEHYLAPFVFLKKGHNVLMSERDGYCRSWGFLSQSGALFPKPLWLWEEPAEAQAERDFSFTFEHLKKTLEQFSPAERRRSSRRVQRVLVLSHLFPNENQKNCGCFVAEQVKALREHENIDARVVSCQPYWVNTLNPRVTARLMLDYRRGLRNDWFLHQGVPTMLVPYLVGKLFRHRLHGFTYALSAAITAAEIRKDFKFDLVHAHTGYMDGFAGLWLSRKYGVPLVVTEHTGPFSLLTRKHIIREITVKSLKSADRVICVSPSLEKEVKRWLPEEVYGKIVCMPNGVDTDFFKPGANTGPKRPCRILSVISLDENKNPFCLLEAFRELKMRRPDAVLTVVGDGPLRSGAEKWVEEKGLSGSVCLTGWKSRDEVAALMRESCDLFVLPSRSETFGVVVIEAMSSGKPVVSTRCGGPESILTEEYLGELCQSDSPASLAQSMEKVLGNIEKYPATRIRSFVMHKYGYKHLSRKIVDLYEDVASNRKGRLG